MWGEAVQLSAMSSSMDEDILSSSSAHDFCMCKVSVRNPRNSQYMRPQVSSGYVYNIYDIYNIIYMCIGPWELMKVEDIVASMDILLCSLGNPAPHTV